MFCVRPYFEAASHFLIGNEMIKRLPRYEMGMTYCYGGRANPETTDDTYPEHHNWSDSSEWCSAIEVAKLEEELAQIKEELAEAKRALNTMQDR